MAIHLKTINQMTTHNASNKRDILSSASTMIRSGKLWVGNWMQKIFYFHAWLPFRVMAGPPSILARLQIQVGRKGSKKKFFLRFRRRKIISWSRLVFTKRCTVVIWVWCLISKPPGLFKVRFLKLKHTCIKNCCKKFYKNQIRGLYYTHMPLELPVSETTIWSITLGA